ncbi:hypothetical protein TNIN_250181 [Trichonephila inaurata madagascariensis]|uniref:Uncharacterized protein n=1 Tax=Trichonephila inaurata madagascariensis TaxID=2747483 RepID=A0A8X7CEH3_9ARAC|nr:hypothetical protein TNIN_250181 [Trichonephila inaurata madagascariensis]
MMIKSPVNFASEEAKPLIEFLKRTLNLTMLMLEKEQRDTEPRLMQFPHIFLVDYNRGILYLISQLPVSFYQFTVSFYQFTVSFSENDDTEN